MECIDSLEYIGIYYWSLGNLSWLDLYIYVSILPNSVFQWEHIYSKPFNLEVLRRGPPSGWVNLRENGRDMLVIDTEGAKQGPL